MAKSKVPKDLKDLVKLDSELSVDSKGNATVKQSADIGVASVNISIRQNPDGSYGLSGDAKVRVGGIVDAKANHSESLNTATGQESSSSSVGLGIDGKSLLNDASAGADLTILQHDGVSKPSALDPNIRISTEEFSTNVKVGGSVGGGKFKDNKSVEVIGLGVAENKLENENGGDERKPILSETTLTTNFFGWNTGTILETPPSDFANEIIDQKVELDDLKSDLKKDPNNVSIANEIEEINQAIFNNELKEVVSISEVAQQDFLGDKSKGWSISADYRTNNTQAYFTNTDGTYLFVNRATSQLIYHRPDGKTSVFDYSDTSNPLREEYAFGSNENPFNKMTFIDGGMVLSNGEQTITVTANSVALENKFGGGQIIQADGEGGTTWTNNDLIFDGDSELSAQTALDDPFNSATDNGIIDIDSILNASSSPIIGPKKNAELNPDPNLGPITEPNPEQSAQSDQQPSQQPNQQSDNTTYTIQSGDSLSEIAAANGTDVSTLLTLNSNISDSNKIQTGTSLNLPKKTANAAPSTFSQENISEGISDGVSGSDTDINTSNFDNANFDSIDASSGIDGLVWNQNSTEEDPFTTALIDAFETPNTNPTNNTLQVASLGNITAEQLADLQSDDPDTAQQAYQQLNDEKKQTLQSAVDQAAVPAAEEEPLFDPWFNPRPNFDNIGQISGEALAGGVISLLEFNNDFSPLETAAITTLVQSFGQNLGQSIDGGGITQLDGTTSSTGFDDIVADTSAIGANVIVGMVASEISNELLAGLDLNQQWGIVAGGIANAGVTAGIEYGINASAGTLGSTAEFGNGFNISSVGYGVASSLVISELGLGAESEAGAAFAAIGSVIGSMWGGPAGAFAGQIIGGMIGDQLSGLFGSPPPPPPPPPKGFLEISFSGTEFDITDIGSNSTGQRGMLYQMGDYYSDQLNTLLQTSGAQIANPDSVSRIRIDFSKDGFALQVGDAINGQFSGQTDESPTQTYSNDQINQVLLDGIKQNISSWQLEGGDTTIKRSILNSQAESINDLQQDVIAGEMYGNYLQQSEAIDEKLSGQSIRSALDTAYKNEAKYQALSEQQQALQQQIDELQDAQPTLQETYQRLKDYYQSDILAGEEITDTQETNYQKAKTALEENQSALNDKTQQLANVDQQMQTDSRDNNLNTDTGLTNLNAELSILRQYDEAITRVEQDGLNQPHADENISRLQNLMDTQGVNISQYSLEDINIGKDGDGIIIEVQVQVASNNAVANNTASTGVENRLETTSSIIPDTTPDATTETLRLNITNWYQYSSENTRLVLNDGTEINLQALLDKIDINTIVGTINLADVMALQTGDRNTYSGTDSADILVSNGTFTTLEGGAGADTLIGTSDAATASYQSSAQGIYIDLQNNLTAGGDASGDQLQNINNLRGSENADSLQGNAQNNTLQGGGGNDQLSGGKGNDILLGGAGDDAISAGAGNDDVRGGAGNDQIILNEGRNQAAGGAGIDLIVGGDGSELITGGSGDDALYGGGGNDQLIGGEGADTLLGGSGSDTLVGGAGTDTALFEGKLSQYDIHVASTREQGSDQISNQVNNNLYIYNENGDIDRLNSIEKLEFADGSIDVESIIQAQNAHNEEDENSNASIKNTASTSAGTSPLTTAQMTAAMAAYGALIAGAQAQADNAVANNLAASPALPPNSPLVDNLNSAALNGPTLNDQWQTNVRILLNADNATTTNQNNGQNSSNTSGVPLYFNSYGGNNSALNSGLNNIAAGNGLNDSILANSALTNNTQVDNSATTNSNIKNSEQSTNNGATTGINTTGAASNTSQQSDANTGINPNNNPAIDANSNSGTTSAPTVDIAIVGTTGTVSGNEDTAIAIPLQLALIGEGGTTTVAIILSNVPPGAQLSAGVFLGNGQWRLTQQQLPDLSITPAENNSSDFTLQLAAIAIGISGDQQITYYEVPVQVNAVADIAIINNVSLDTIQPAANGGNDNINGTNQADILYGGAQSDTLNGGAGDDILYGDSNTLTDTITASVNISVALTDLDGSESFTVSLFGLPENAQLSQGVLLPATNGVPAGTWVLNGAELAAQQGNIEITVLVNDIPLILQDTDDTQQGLVLQVVTNTSDTDPDTGKTVSINSQPVPLTISIADRQAGDDILNGNLGDDILYGEAGNDTLTGGLGSDQLFGGDGDDILHIDRNDTQVAGGDGFDTAIIDNTNNRLLDSNTVFTNVEKIIGSNRDDTIAAGNNGVQIDGSGGNDQLTGGSGNDVLTGGDGQDALLGNAGNDTLNADIQDFVNGDAFIRGGEGFDTLNIIDNISGDISIDLEETSIEAINASNGDDTITSGDSANQINGGKGQDTVSYANATSAVTINLATNIHSGDKATGDTLTSIENIIGSNFNDSLTGDANNNTFSGGQGDDTIDGGDGFNTVKLTGANTDYIINFTVGNRQATISQRGESDKNNGTDTLVNIDQIKFSNKYTLNLDGTNNNPYLLPDDLQETKTPFITFDEDSAGAVVNRNNPLFIDRFADYDGDEISITSISSSKDYNNVEEFPNRIDISGVKNANTSELENNLTQINYIVTDGQGSMATDVMDLRINAVNDAPTINFNDFNNRDIIRADFSERGGNRFFSSKRRMDASGYLPGDDVEDPRDQLTFEKIEGTSIATTVTYTGVEAGRVVITNAGNFDGMIAYRVTDTEGGWARLNFFIDRKNPNFEVKAETYLRGGAQQPIAIDLDGNGIDYVGLLDSTIYLDANNDGITNKTAWVGANDGFLTIDLNQDGIVNGFSELNLMQFHPDATTDLEGLALAFDSNNDTIFNNKDKYWDLFNIWQDKNQNGISDAGEVKTLDEIGISEIDLSSGLNSNDADDPVSVAEIQGDVKISGEGSVTFDDGRSTTYADITLLYETENNNTNNTENAKISIDQNINQADITQHSTIEAEAQNTTVATVNTVSSLPDNTSENPIRDALRENNRRYAASLNLDYGPDEADADLALLSSMNDENKRIDNAIKRIVSEVEASEEARRIEALPPYTAVAAANTVSSPPDGISEYSFSDALRENNRRYAESIDYDADKADANIALLFGKDYATNANRPNTVEENLAILSGENDDGRDSIMKLVDKLNADADARHIEALPPWSPIDGRLEEIRNLQIQDTIINEANAEKVSLANDAGAGIGLADVAYNDIIEDEYY